MRGLGPNQQKILLLLLGGLALGMNTSPRQAYRIIGAVEKEWRKIDREKGNLERSLKALEKKKLIAFRKKGGVWFPTLTARGRQQAFFAGLQQMTVPIPNEWDGRWRVVLFDVPEDDRKIRNFLRRHLKRMNFVPLQESVFVHAFDCEEEIRKLSDYYGNGAYIRFLEASRIDDEGALKLHYDLC